MTQFLSITWNPVKGIDLGFFTLHFYSLLWMVAFGLGWVLTKKIFDREGESVEKLDKLFMYTLFATMLGARLGHVIFYQPELFQQDFFSVFLPVRFKPEFEFTGFTGLASHGAAMAVVATMLYYSKRVIHRPFLWVLDRITIPVVSGGIFIRIANFINSEILGSVTSANTLTAVRFIRGEDNLNENDALLKTKAKSVNEAYKLIETDPRFKDILASIPYRHPAQMYEAFCYVFVFIIVFYMYWRTDARKYHGLLFGVFLVLLWGVRFGVEFLKQSQGGFEESLHILSTGQWLSIPFILVGFYLIFTAKNRVETL